MQKRAEKTRQKILDTATTLFAAKGFSGTVIDDIAAEAGVNKQRIYAYFKSKSNLFESVTAEVFNASSHYDKKLLVLGEADIPSMTLTILNHYLDTYKLRPEFWRLIAWANLELGDGLKSIKGLKSESLEHIRKLYLKGIEKNLFRNIGISFETYIYILWSATFFYNSNRTTLMQSLGSGIFEEEKRSVLFSEIATLFHQP